MALDKSAQSALLTEIRDLIGMGETENDAFIASVPVTIYRTSPGIDDSKKHKNYLLDSSHAKFEEAQYWDLPYTAADGTSIWQGIVLGDHTKKDSDNLWTEYTGE
mgnify:CR=1 FL=1